MDINPAVMLPAAENIFPPAPVFEQVHAVSAEKLRAIVEEVRLTGVAAPAPPRSAERTSPSQSRPAAVVRG